MREEDEHDCERISNTFVEQHRILPYLFEKREFIDYFGRGVMGDHLHRVFMRQHHVCAPEQRA